MGCRIKGPSMPVLNFKHSAMRFLLLCVLFVLSDAMKTMDFSGTIYCLEDEILIKKPKDVQQLVWQKLHVVDSSGFEVDACHLSPHGSLLTIPETCVNHETGKRVAHISLHEHMRNKTVYLVSCNGDQADSDYTTPIITCTKDYIMATIPRTLTGFDDEIISTPSPASSWTIGIHNGTLVKVNVAAANAYGYTLTSDRNFLMIRTRFDAFGIQEVTFRGQKFYRGNVSLIQERRNPRITIDVKIICARGPPTCNSTHMTLWIPHFDGYLQNIAISDQDIPLTTSALQQQGITLDTTNGVQMNIALTKLQSTTFPGGISYRLPSLTLTFIIDGLNVPMTLSPECLVKNASSSPMAACTSDGFMQIEVFASNTRPSLDLNTVTLRDPTCRPQDRTNSRIFFKFPLSSCGTTKQYVAGRLFYENEVSALWKNFPPRSISRDSELRETVWCFYNGSDLKTINVTVVTLPPPISTRNDGPLLLVIDIYPDLSYQRPYSEDQYPVVKVLRDPIYLEVQVLNRNDPNIELVLDDCWATMSQDANALPQWNVIVDGCQESQDNYLTIFHPVDVTVPKATHRKRFEVKAFAFMQGGELSTNLVYFHCSAIICNINSPDSPLCNKRCFAGRRRRDELFLNRHSNLASLPGPVLLVDSEPSLSLDDEQDVVKQVTIGVLPAFALVAVIVLVALLIHFRQKSKS
ncbi:zona pellucida sperm-binding protein 2 [Ranitomeya variabilis]|uniref:zona pellucida sperm-binding protein 2 n=1 Tax=Ranitomeya variabilis TaxID=490064 RepID=UPI004056BE9B